MTPQDLLQHFGDQASIARAFNIKPPSVHEWFTSGRIPIDRQCQAEVLTRGKLKADRATLAANGQ